MTHLHVVSEQNVRFTRDAVKTMSGMSVNESQIMIGENDSNTKVLLCRYAQVPEIYPFVV